MTRVVALAALVALTACAEPERTGPERTGTQTSAGYLEPRYAADDATHANPAYSALMLAQLKAHVLGVRADERIPA